MSFLTSYADTLARNVEQMLGASEQHTAQDDVKAWIKRVVEVTWLNQPQNVYNLIALACALVFIFYGTRLAQKHLDIKRINMSAFFPDQKATPLVVPVVAAAPAAKRSASKKPAKKAAKKSSSRSTSRPKRSVSSKRN